MKGRTALWRASCCVHQVGRSLQCHMSYIPYFNGTKTMVWRHCTW